MRPRIWVRDTEMWIGKFGFFWGRVIVGIELPNGNFYGWTK